MTSLRRWVRSLLFIALAAFLTSAAAPAVVQAKTDDYALPGRLEGDPGDGADATGGAGSPGTYSADTVSSSEIAGFWSPCLTIRFPKVIVLALPGGISVVSFEVYCSERSGGEE